MKAGLLGAYPSAESCRWASMLATHALLLLDCFAVKPGLGVLGGDAIVTGLRIAMQINSVRHAEEQ